MNGGEAFTRLMEEYGAAEDEGGRSKRSAARRATTTGVREDDKELKEAKDVLMQLEERTTGAVPWSTYKRYLVFVGGSVVIPAVLAALLINQAIAGE